MLPFFKTSQNNERQTNRPPGMPPNFTPQKGQGKKMGAAPIGGPGGISTFAVDTGAIAPCVNRFVYIWPTNGPGFWAFLTFVGPRSIAGFRFQGRRSRYFGMDLRRIDEFYCF